MQSYSFSVISDDFLYSVISFINLVIIEVIPLYDGFVRTWLSGFNLLRRWLFFVFITDVWVFGLARFMGFDIFVRRWCSVCSSIDSFISFVLRDLALGRLMFLTDGCFLPFDGILFFAYIGVHVVGSRWRCPIDR